ncbi:MAG: hypothetical protein LBD11_04535 [Candidatus Peribacteria bacterium]|jgi:hypothetical protein|nr:hypothetical protein [Candidatus Peribacteria bacterium]
MKKFRFLFLLFWLMMSGTAIAKNAVVQKGAFLLPEDYTKIDFPVKQQIGEVFSTLEREGDVILWTISLKGVGAISTVTLGTDDCGCNDKFTSEGEGKFLLDKESTVFQKPYYKSKVKMSKGKTLFGEGMVYSFTVEKHTEKAGVVNTWEWIFTVILLVLIEFLLFTRTWTNAVRDDNEGWCISLGVALTAVTLLLWIFPGAWFPLELGIYLALIGGITYYMWGHQISSYLKRKKKERIDKRVAKATEHLSL